jgi:hypothetical protein
LDAERARFLEDLPSWSWDPVEDDWQDSYIELKLFVKKKGHAKLSQCSNDPAEKQPALWVNRQRMAYRQKNLTEEKIKALESLPEWSWDPREDNWQRMYAEFQVFVRENGHAKPNQRSANLSERQLALWMKRQHLCYRRKNLSKERIQALESLSGWKWFK